MCCVCRYTIVMYFCCVCCVCRYTIATGSVEDRALFKKASFHYAIFDEGHMLKNMASMRFQNLMKISVSVLCCMLLIVYCD